MINQEGFFYVKRGIDAHNWYNSRGFPRAKCVSPFNRE